MKYQKKRTPNRSCYAPFNALWLTRNRTSRSARGLPNVCTIRGSTVHPADPTKRRADAWNHGYSALPPMLMHERAYPTIFYAQGYHSVFTLHRQSRYDAKNLSLFAAVHTWKDVVRRLSASTRTASSFFCFWIIPHTFKRFESVVWSTSNNSAGSASVWHESSSSNASNSSS